MEINSQELFDEFYDDLFNLSKTYAEETQYGINFSVIKGHEFLFNAVHNLDTGLFINIIDSVVTGAVIVHRKQEFTKEYFGFILKFYVMPEYRGTSTARSLMTEAMQWFDKNQVVYSYIAPAGMIGQDKLFINLLKKFKYEQGNPTYIRKGNYGN